MPDDFGPSLWQVMAADPSNPMDRAILQLVISDQRCPSRAFLYPWMRVLSRLAVAVIVIGKRAFPFRFCAHATMDRMCLWFLRRCVSPTAVRLLIRHSSLLFAKAVPRFSGAHICSRFVRAIGVVTSPEPRSISQQGSSFSTTQASDGAVRS